MLNVSSLSLPPLRIRGRSFLALVLTPEAPLTEWLARLDEQIKRSTFFFHGKPVILNLELLTGEEEGLEQLYHVLSQKNIQIVSIEGKPTLASAIASWPKNFIFSGGKNIDKLTPPVKSQPVPCHVVDEPVRSGQTVFFPEGDVVITSSVASGAELVAGGSIHVYGVLRGRAIAGTSGQPNARIFANQMEAELLTIDGYYMTAEEIPAELIGKPAQVYLDSNIIQVKPLSKIK